MSIRRFLARCVAVAATVGLTGVAGAGAAWAHVTADPEQAEQGGYANIAFRVPNEKDDAGTVEVKVTLPREHPLSSVSTKPLPGWTVKMERVTLPEPVEVAGSEVSETVRSITWTAKPGTRIDPGEFQEFEVSLGALPTKVDRLVLPTVQTYDNGDVVKWDDPPAQGGREPEHPAPTLRLVAGSGHSHGGPAPAGPAPAGSGQDGPAQGGSGQGKAVHSEPSHAHASDSTARWLGGAGLVIGALGLGVGAGALLRTRQARGGERS